jgi:hypothetical protein
MPEVQYPRPRIYVAGASADIDILEAWIRRLVEVGFDITFDWTKQVRQVGAANPRDASWEDRLTWANQDREGVLKAQYFWLLIPSAKPSIGCWIEYGMATNSTFHRPVGFISGDIESTIFSAWADHRFKLHEAAFQALCQRIPRHG